MCRIFSFLHVQTEIREAQGRNSRRQIFAILQMTQFVLFLGSRSSLEVEVCLVHFDPNELSHFGKQGLLKLGGFRNNLRMLVRVVFTGFEKICEQQRHRTI